MPTLNLLHIDGTAEIEIEPENHAIDNMTVYCDYHVSCPPDSMWAAEYEQSATAYVEIDGKKVRIKLDEAQKARLDDAVHDAANGVA
jgi:hypothetical protein